jgi:hypothetical protein
MLVFVALLAAASAQFPASDFNWILNQTAPGGDGVQELIVQSDTRLSILTFNTTQGSKRTLYADAFVAGTQGAGTCGFDPSSGFACVLACSSGQNCHIVPGDLCPVCSFIDLFAAFVGHETGRSCGAGGSEYNVSLTLMATTVSASLCFSRAKQMPLALYFALQGKTIIGGETLSFQQGSQPTIAVPKTCACKSSDIVRKPVAMSSPAAKALTALFGQ